MHIITRLLLLPLLALALLTPMAQPAPAMADEPDLGYLWSIFFSFEQNFDGLLTIEVGPWGDGDLLAVEETSTAVVSCKPVGNVYLSGGDAHFEGGYLSCDLDLAGVVQANHGLLVQPVDTYGSILLRARLKAAEGQLAPLFSHPDAVYSLDFTQAGVATMRQKLNIGADPLQASFSNVMPGSFNSYTYQYRCYYNTGLCDGTFRVGQQSQTVPSAGKRISFATAPTVFHIGHDQGSLLSGRMSSLLIDPGNSVH